MRADRVLSSDWGGDGGLSPHLLARIYPLNKDPSDGTCTRVPDSYEVRAPITGDASIEYTLNWQSPFENTSPESKLPALAALLQSNALQPLANQMASIGQTVQAAIGELLGIGGGAAAAEILKQEQAINASLKQFQGRSGMTRLNSTQVFTGMPPAKFQITLLFRAMTDPAREVEAPLAQLLQWALPAELSQEGLLVGALQKSRGGGEPTPADLLMPSLAPTLLAFQYHGRTYAPVVIESIAEPITSPIDSKARYTTVQVPITIGSLTAMDAKEMAGIRRGQNPYLRTTQ